MYHHIKGGSPVEGSHMYHLIKGGSPVEGSHMYHLIKVVSPVEGGTYDYLQLDQHAELDFYSANSLTQLSVGRHVAPLRHIILIPSQSVFALNPSCCVLSGEATNTNFKVFGLTRSLLEHTIY
jgi:hypothetical protein